MIRNLLLLLVLFALNSTAAVAALPVNASARVVIQPVKVKPFYITALEQKLGRHLKWKEKLALKWAVHKQMRQAKKKQSPENAHKLGVTSLLCGAGSFLFLLVPGLNMITPVLALAAIVFGFISLGGKSKKNAEAIWGIILGFAFITFLIIAIAALTFTIL